MKYKKPPFPFNLILNSIIFVFFSMFFIIPYAYPQGGDNSSFLGVVIFISASVLGYIIYSIVMIRNYFVILGLMKDDKYIICKDFYHEVKEVHTQQNETHVYSFTVTEIIDGNGKTRNLKSKNYPINHNPFEDGRTEIKIFIDIDKHYSPYYFYPYSEN